MKRKLLTILCCGLISGLSYSQISIGQTSDFQDGTTQSWVIGGAGAGSGPVNVADAGPDGVGDNALQYESFGSGMVASRMVFYTTGADWSGNYTTAGIEYINMMVNVTGNDLNLRIAVQGGGGRFCTTDAVNVPAGSGWTSVSIRVRPSDFTSVQGGFDIDNTLETVNTLRILSNTSPDWRGEIIAAVIQADDIEASDTLSNTEFEQENEFTISPNPAKNKLNIALPQVLENASINVFDVLGKRIYTGTLNSLKPSINVTSWNSGVYLVRIANDNTVQTKRFVKQ